MNISTSASKCRITESMFNSNTVKLISNDDKENHASPMLRKIKDNKVSIRTPVSSAAVSSLTSSRRKFGGIMRSGCSTSTCSTPQSAKLQTLPDCSQLQASLSDLPPVEAETVAISVYVRVRPEEKNFSRLNSLSGDSRSIKVSNACHSAYHCFCYDGVLWSLDPSSPQYADQQCVYHTVASPLLRSALLGFNVCLLAYGQTGSGKTYSMMGKMDGEFSGIIPRFCRNLFEEVNLLNCSDDDGERLSVQMNFYEIYNERIKDLLMDDGGVLRVREHPDFGPQIVGITTTTVLSWADAEVLIETGNRRRATASTVMNNKSSRSHSVLTLSLVKSQINNIDGDCLETTRTSVVNLVDLAGSERTAHINSTALRKNEGVRINMSLLALGKVISSLADDSSSHVPYRDSKLTWLLKESLGGNSRTTLLATVSASDAHTEETLSTLRYASIAGKVFNKVFVNEDPCARIIRQLREEVDRLRLEHGQQVRCESVDPTTCDEATSKADMSDSPTVLRCRLTIAQLKRKLQQRDMLLKSRDKELHRVKRQLTAGTAVSASAHLPMTAGVPYTGCVSSPCLIILLPDPALSETVAFALPEGSCTLGCSSQDTIQLRGLALQPAHCVLECHNGRVQVCQNEMDGGDIFVNGRVVTSLTALQHGDRLVLAAEVFLRLQLPARQVLGLAGFEQAMHELDKHNKQRDIQEKIALRTRVKNEIIDELKEREFDHEMDLRSKKDSLKREIDCLDRRLHELQRQKLLLESSDCSQSHIGHPSSPDQCPNDFNLLQSIKDMLDSPAIGSSVNGDCSESVVGDVNNDNDAVTSQLVLQCNAMLSRLDKDISLEQDLQLESDGSLRPVILVIDRKHDIFSVWEHHILAEKYEILKNVCEEHDSSGNVDSECLVSVLDSGSIWQPLDDRRRHSHRLMRRKLSSVSCGDTNVDYKCVASVLSSLLNHSARHLHCSDDVSSLLKCVSMLSSMLKELENLSVKPSSYSHIDQCLVGLSSAFYQLLSCFGVWCRSIEPENDHCVSQLEECINRTQSILAFIFTGISVSNAMLVENNMKQCLNQLTRFCRLLGAVEQISPHSDLELCVSTLSCYCDGVLMAVDHEVVLTVGACEHAESRLTALIDDSSTEHLSVWTKLCSSTHEMTACLRCFLTRIRSHHSDYLKCDSPDDSDLLNSRLKCFTFSLNSIEGIRSSIEEITSSLVVHRQVVGSDDDQYDAMRNGLCVSGRRLFVDLIHWIGHCVHVTRSNDESCRRILLVFMTECLSACRSLLRLLPPVQMIQSSETGEFSVQWSELNDSTVTLDHLLHSKTTDLHSMFTELSTSELLSISSLTDKTDTGHHSSSFENENVAERLRHAVQLLQFTPSRSCLRTGTPQIAGPESKHVHFSTDSMST